jgi:hypothetical protein
MGLSGTDASRYRSRPVADHRLRNSLEPTYPCFAAHAVVSVAMSVIIEPLGGLGNQLFVYGAGLALARRLHTDLIADLRNFQSYEWHNYELDSMNLSIDRLRPPRAPEWTVVERSFELGRRVKDRLSRWPRGRLLLEAGYGFDPSVLRIRSGIRLRGYFASWRYLHGVEEEVRQSMSSLASPSKWYVETRDFLSSIAPWTGVHVRRGNYRSIPTMGLASMEYYARALRLINTKSPAQRVVVFSDEPQVALAEVPGDFADQTIVVDPPETSRPIESLLLMSGAANLVTANSTFSWWAAWHGDRPGRMVVVPRPWLDGIIVKEADLFLPQWVSVGR